MFDFKKPYGEVSGNPDGPQFFQNGKFYDAQHREVTENGVIVKAKAPAPPAPPEDLPDTVEPGEDVSEEDVLLNTLGEQIIDDIVAGRPEINLDELSWQEIKRRVEAAGGEWVNKIEGIAYLKGM